MLMGAHIARLVRTPINPSLVLALVSLLSLAVVSLGDISERDPNTEALLTFKDSLANPSALGNWNASTKPCQGDRANWIGVLCLKGIIWGLQLENMGLAGRVNIQILVSLPTLRTLSLMNNNFEGTMPDIRKLSSLKALYLSNNRFTGDIPDNSFEGMGSLKKVFLANNAFTGKIPTSLTTLPKLMMLRLEGNIFEGRIPDFRQESLKVVNFANNELEGPIPAIFSKMGPSTFSGNRNLCGQPLPSCNLTRPAARHRDPKSANKEISSLKIALIAVCILLLLVILTVFILILPRRRQQKSKALDATDIDDSNKMPSYDHHEGDQKKSDAAAAAAMKRSDHGKLIFLKDNVPVFDLQDLLRASAEVLGSGNFGASYKAVIMNGVAVVVKRYKQMNNVGREDFHEHMRRLGRLNHPNLLPVVAYYYRREEKLLVSEFMENGSLASRLHGNRTADQPSLDWATRVKIIKGVAKGLAYLYSELPSLIVPHGHLKSSNVLLDESMEPLLCDYSLRPVINQEQAHMVMTAYKSPEYAMNSRICRKTDVWCLGILILEILTGKFPENYLTQGYNSNTNLAAWVNDMVMEKKSGEVFDKEMPGTKNSKSEMISLLKIGLSCCEEDIESRPDMKEVVNNIEQLKEGFILDDDDASSTVGEVNAVISRGNVGDDSFFSYDR